MPTQPRDADATRRRLLEAAAEEFAARGIAGARVDRIAAAAQSNKAQIYHYFGSKDGLFDAVFDQMVAATLDDTPIDAAALPEYAGRLFDRYVAHPRQQRLAAWYRLERAGSTELIDAVVASNEHKTAAIAQAQAAGTVSDAFAPAVLLALVLSLSATWASMVPEYEAVVADVDTAARRQAVVDAVTALVQRDP